MSDSSSPDEIYRPLPRRRLSYVALRIHYWCQLAGVLEHLRKQWAQFVQLQTVIGKDLNRRDDEYLKECEAGGLPVPPPGPVTSPEPWIGEWEPPLLFQYGLLVAIHDGCIQEVRQAWAGTVEPIVCETAGFNLISKARVFLPKYYGQLDDLHPNVVEQTLEAVSNDLVEQGLVSADKLSEIDATIEAIEHAAGDGDKPRPADSAAQPSLTKEAAAVLLYLNDRFPILLTLDDIETGADLSRATAQKATRELIAVHYAHRPSGPNKGIAITNAGRSVAAKLITKSAQT